MSPEGAAEPVDICRAPGAHRLNRHKTSSLRPGLAYDAAPRLKFGCAPRDILDRLEPYGTAIVRRTPEGRNPELQTWPVRGRFSICVKSIRHNLVTVRFSTTAIAWPVFGL
jgi:hypothetical protein